MRGFSSQDGSYDTIKTSVSLISSRITWISSIVNASSLSFASIACRTTAQCMAFVQSVNVYGIMDVSFAPSITALAMVPELPLTTGLATTETILLMPELVHIWHFIHFVFIFITRCFNQRILKMFKIINLFTYHEHL